MANKHVRHATDDGRQRGLRVNRYVPCTVGDALFSAGVLHAIHRTAGHASAVTKANPWSAGGPQEETDERP